MNYVEYSSNGNGKDKNLLFTKEMLPGREPTRNV